MKCDEIV